MRKNVFGRRLQRDVHERKALFRSLMRELIVREKIQTTEAKAKAIKADIEKAVTKVKKNPMLAKQRLQADFSVPIIRKLVDEIAPRFSKRQGGYTRILHRNNRLNDNANMVMIEWTEKSADRVQKSEVGLQKTEKQIPEIIDAEIVAKSKVETKNKSVKSARKSNQSQAKKK